MLDELLDHIVVFIYRQIPYFIHLILLYTQYLRRLRIYHGHSSFTASADLMLVYPGTGHMNRTGHMHKFTGLIRTMVKLHRFVNRQSAGFANIGRYLSAA